MAFGDVVRARRTELAIGLNDLAERMGISPGYWSRIERNLDKPPSDEVVQRAAAILGIPLDALFVEAERLPPDIESDAEELSRILTLEHDARYAAERQRLAADAAAGDTAAYARLREMPVTRPR